ncbi:MAG: hypothetical protein ABI254_11075, partial [Chthoniobacterales bacterium]
MKRSIKLKLVTSLVCLLSVGAGAKAAVTWRVEAEAAGKGIMETLPGEKPSWEVIKLAEASGGAFLGGKNNGETHPITVRIPEAGTYKIWVRHYTTPGAYSNFYVLLRDDIGASIKMERIDWMSPLITQHPYEKKPELQKGAKPSFVWTPFEVTFERPMDATISFGNPHGRETGVLGIDCLVISNDPAFDPNKSDWAKLATDAGVKDLPAVKPPAGMIPIPSIVPHVSFFSGVPNVKDQFSINLIAAWPSFNDYPFTLQLGVNHDTCWFYNPGKYGVHVDIDPQEGYTTADLYAKTPKPTGRFINSDGNVSRYFSYSYEPFREAMVKEYAANLQHYKDNTDIEQFRIA